MKRILLIPALCGLMIASFVIDTGAWDLPASFDLLQVKFNHNTSSSSSDAITIQSGYGSDIVAPEWDNDGATNNKCAYIKSTVPTVKANFYCDADGRATFDSLKIETFRSTGEYDWHLNSTKVTFTYNESGYISFQANLVPTTVGSWVVGWSWRIIEVDGVVQSPAKVCGSTTHYYYTVLSDPQTPMSKPWTQVLNYACAWASGETSSSGVINKVTLMAYTNNFKNYNWDYSHVDTLSTGSRHLELTSLFSDNNCDCKDMAAVVQVFSNALGVSNVYMKRISGQFYYIAVDPIGTTNPDGWWTNGSWFYHQVGWYSSSVYDACIRIDQDNPRVPRGENIDGVYKDDLYSSGTWNVNPGTAYIGTLD